MSRNISTTENEYLKNCVSISYPGHGTLIIEPGEQVRVLCPG